MSLHDRVRRLERRGMAAPIDMPGPPVPPLADYHDQEAGRMAPGLVSEMEALLELYDELAIEHSDPAALPALRSAVAAAREEIGR